MYKRQPMDYLVMRVCDGGKPLTRHMRIATEARGSLRIAQERAGRSKRVVLVARLVPMGAHRPIPALFDVSLVKMEGEYWTLSGYELVTAGVVRHDVAVGQAWIVRPAQVDDLIVAERKVNELAERLEAMRTSHGGAE